ncbi:M4 family metallopeptidase [Nocardioides sp. NPDC000445]|uniref:M4 family metallopeptidase n=1 Tax=Nocardioides sp. NPDC000445 TaxID=3154257 RepID=UPI00331FE308
MSPRRRVVALTATALAIGGLSVLPMTPPASAEPDPVATYKDRAGVPLTVHRTADGTADFIGSTTEAVDPLGVTVKPAKAAEAHLDRAAEALGAEQTDLRQTSTSKAVGGGSVTRYEQYVDGLPVLGGEVVIGLDKDRGLTSAATNLSDATVAEVTQPDESMRAKAKAAAKTVVAKSNHGATGLTVSDEGTWLYDHDLVRGPEIGETSVFRFSVTNGSTIRETVLAHAGTGRVLMHINEIAHANRRICDNANVRAAATGCADTSLTVKRRESDAPSGLADVDKAYDMLGATSELYASLGLDLTEEIGWSSGVAGKAITATTRYCEPTQPGYTPPCPMDNAFWNGQQIYLGQGLVVDDIVGHELTHGVIERSSNLFYWYESGAINESMADIMGEIVDHRYATPGDSPTDWRVGEDSSFGAIRDLANPTVHDQPDRMTSSLWEADDLSYYADGGGVHTNSGVGNKTAHLISQGGTFNGRTISGIDVGDPTLQKTAALYLYTIQHLVSGSQYADLGRTLSTGCDALAAAGTSGFTPDDCTQVDLAAAATELAKSPTKAGATRPAEAPNTCPAGSTGKAGMATPALSRGVLWTQAPDAAQGIPANDRDGNGSDFGMNPDPAAYGDPTSSGLTTAAINVPAGKRTYLRFSHWYLFEWYTGDDPAYPTPQYFDGGEARLLVNGVATAIPSTAWVNGPKQKLLLNNPSRPLTGFGGDSNGWISSRVDLSSFAGKTVQFQWVVRGDSEGSFVGWFVDGLELYTCNPQTIASTAPPTISGTARVGYTLTATKGSWSPTATTVKYQWLRNGVAISGATASTYKLTGSDHTKEIRVRVTAYSSSWPAANPGVRASAATARIAAGYLTAVTPTIGGTRRVGYLLTAYPGAWKPSGITFSYQWLRNGVAISGATGKTYRLRSVDRGDRIRVRVTGRKAGYYTKTATSAATSTIR